MAKRIFIHRRFSIAALISFFSEIALGGANSDSYIFHIEDSYSAIVQELEGKFPVRVSEYSHNAILVEPWPKISAI